MNAIIKPVATNAVVSDFLADQERKTLLRFLTCGSVDDGKSTLIGRLLYDTKLIFEDQLASLKNDSRKFGTTDDDFDFALLVDGLEAEREQGITIDVAYRFFSTPRRKFIVADTPGHAQYTRNMATGASTADLAIVLIDARQGVLTQTRRHSFIAAALGIRHIVLAVNKIDLVDFSQEAFERIVADYMSFANELGFVSIQPIPLSARFGDNVTLPSPRMDWYEGPHLLEHLETVRIDTEAAAKPFRFPVQYVNRPNLDFRGFSGTVASGSISAGDAVVVAKSGKTSRVKRIATYDGDLPRASEGQAVTLVLEDEIEVSRGNMLVGTEARPEVADRLSANIVWFGEEALHPGRSYILRTETDQTPVTINEIVYRTDIDSFTRQEASRLDLNEIGLCHLQTVDQIAFDPYADNRVTGAFVLIDRLTNATVGAGMIDSALRQATNVHLQSFDLDKQTRAAQKFQKPAVLWFTGLSGSGKSTIANRLEQRLHALGKHTYLLDGDNVRHGLNSDLGFSDEDRAENIRRVGEVARLMTDAGLVVLVSFISPFQAERDRIRARLPEGEFVEIFVDTPIEECIARDPKGLYAQALRGEIKAFTGIDSPYEAPVSPELRLSTTGRDVDELVAEVEKYLAERGIIGSYGSDSWSI
ncbi:MULTISPECIES: sulfate adenylyltransferase subunit CysN [Brucella/Ochrobactrum group]|uniref:Multifunctional fusion protein n=1 Tax=Brucella anthropi (strain ATCC 49188 / DSM 6882 / CCUG 24695 / JCM 21032 / LMG 3331 / NBRC 15819 / NCTC 12168 / Alc 37) TaxID=439375 RepID=A6WVC8_BRUA4|nr:MULTISPECIES: sulfate adenylyltransferase subunit CysN [Brucella/Ochrobactrum group]ABS12932.1 sulfate adenylyltransferase, large subunit [Brucella anthropi ATCC 49188]KAB2734969.1 sulfate adenylyltransferase subunit CysN [Brucella anthropi]KAB2763744.1 sulfate adenylyltransferase subunit CysN [Brucella anthropi]KAB2779408.1 sulfate adenylyltransferase subunit CysN [Brucella anthropi]MCQ9144481.1 sulfate adenylyltransferase subunit CysN [Ochrobactrum sp. BTU2]